MRRKLEHIGCADNESHAAVVATIDEIFALASGLKKSTSIYVYETRREIQCR